MREERRTYSIQGAVTTLILQAYTCELVLFCAIHLFRGTVLPFLSATKEMMTAITDTKRHRLPQEYCAST